MLAERAEVRRADAGTRDDGSGADARVRRLPVSTRQASQEKAAPGRPFSLGAPQEREIYVTYGKDSR